MIKRFLRILDMIHRLHIRIQQCFHMVRHEIGYAERSGSDKDPDNPAAIAAFTASSATVPSGVCHVPKPIQGISTPLESR